MTEEEKVSGQAAPAGTGDTETIVSGQAGETGTGETGEGTGEQVVFYTPEELVATPLMEMDTEKIDPSQRPVWEKKISEFKEFQKDYTVKSQELAKLKEKPPEPERHFDDPKKNTAFESYLKEPTKIIGEINAEITNLSGVRPVIDGEDNPEYEKAQRMIAYWNGVKDEFFNKRIEVGDARKNLEIQDTRIDAELGENAKAIREFASTLGFGSADLRKPQLRKSITDMYKVKNPGKGKEVKAKAPNLASPAGSTGGTSVKKPLTEVKNMSEYAARRGFAKDPDRQYD